jgi:hypothetical protein
LPNLKNKAAGYLIVNCSSHTIEINSRELPWLDILDADDKFTTQMKLIPPGFLKKGNNTIQIRQKGSDNIIIMEAVVHWREK